LVHDENAKKTRNLKILTMMSPENTNLAGSQRPTNIRWRVLGILAIVSFVSYTLRGNLSIAAPTMIADLGLSEIQWGWIMAAFPAGYALFQFPGGLFGGKVGPRKALTLIAIAWSVLIIITSMLPGQDVTSATVIIVTLIVVQFLVGAAHAPTFPIVAASIERWFPVGGWGFPNGLTSSGLTLGLAATASLLPWLMGQFGWRMSFIILAPFGFIAAALWWWYARDRPAEHKSINVAEVVLIGVEEEVSEPSEGEKPAWQRVLKNRDILLLMLSYSSMNFVFYILFTWGFYYLVTIRGFGGQEAGFLTSSQWIVAGIGAALGGWICDRQCKRLGLRWGCRVPIIIGMVASGLLLVGVAVHPNAYWAAAMLGLCFFFNQMTEGAYWAISIAIGGRHAGAAGGLMNTGANVMGFINALLVAVIASAFGWAVAIAIGGVFALLGAGLILLVRADIQMDQSD
jgi:ACS family glucarate transporter-like MFS transporter